MKTRSGLAALNLALVCLGFIFVLTTTDGTLKWVLTILIFVCWQAFAVFTVFLTKDNGGLKKKNDKHKEK